MSPFSAVGTTPAESAAVDVMMDQAMDFRNVIVRLAYNPNYVRLPVICLMSLALTAAAAEAAQCPPVVLHCSHLCQGTCSLCMC